MTAIIICSHNDIQNQSVTSCLNLQCTPTNNCVWYLYAGYVVYQSIAWIAHLLIGGQPRQRDEVLRNNGGRRGILPGFHLRSSSKAKAGGVDQLCGVDVLWGSGGARICTRYRADQRQVRHVGPAWARTQLQLLPSMPLSHCTRGIKKPSPHPRVHQPFHRPLHNQINQCYMCLPPCCGTVYPQVCNAGVPHRGAGRGVNGKGHSGTSRRDLQMERPAWRSIGLLGRETLDRVQAPGGDRFRDSHKRVYVETMPCFTSGFF